jgi:uncharacterized protein (DUF58 family)
VTLTPAFFATLERLPLRIEVSVPGTGPGRHRFRSPGGQTEFREHRPYASGDEPRRIDWAAYARTEQYVVKEFEDTRGHLFVPILDGSRSMRAVFGAALEAFATIAVAALRQGDRVAGALARPVEVDRLPRLASIQQVPELAARCAQWAPDASDTPVNWEQTLRAIPALADPSPRAIVLISDLLFEEVEIQPTLARLAQHGHSVTVVHLVSRETLSPPERGAYAVRAAERADAAVFPENEITITADAARAYEREVETWRVGWVSFAHRHAITYHAVDAAAPLGERVAPWLAARSHA